MFLIDEDDLVVIDSKSNGAPSGDRHWLVWNSPFINGTQGPYCRAHPIQNGTIIFVELLARNVRTLAFCKTRRECELLMKSIQNELESRGLVHIQNKVMTYRGGYCISDRREIEYKMSTGCFTGIISTSALELGIDIGEMDAVLHIGFPYNIANLRQQSGRAGRRGRPSLSILIGGNGPIDQYYMSNPDAILNEVNPEIKLMLDDTEILNRHLQCAAYEMPLSIESDEEYFNNNFDMNFLDGKSFEDLVKEKLLPLDDENKEFVFYGPSPEFMPFPSSKFSLRLGSSPEEEDMSYVIMTNEKILENIEIERVPFTLYEGGIFLSQGKMYLIEVLDIKGRLAYAKMVKVNYITKTRDYTDVDPYLVAKSRNLLLDNPHNSKLRISCGLVNVNTCVFGFYKLGRNKTGGYSRILDTVEVSEPNQNIFSLQCWGVWLPLPSDLMEIISKKKLSVAASIHATEHAILSALSELFSNAFNEYEIGTECKSPEKEFKKGPFQRKRPAQLVFFEPHRKSTNDKISRKTATSGVMKNLFERIEDILRLAKTKVENCDCKWGCPNCVASTYCRENSVVLSKPGTLIILRYLCGSPLEINSILDGPEPNLKQNNNGETIVF